MKKSFWELCREARERKKISCSEVARCTGYTHQAISAFETGKNLSVNLDILLWYVRNTDIINLVRNQEGGTRI